MSSAAAETSAMGSEGTAGTPTGAAPQTKWYGAASVHVVQFLNNLRMTPASSWLEVAATAPIEDEPIGDRTITPLLEEQVDYAARRRLHAVLESMPAVVRRIRNRVNNDLAVFEGIMPSAAMQRMRRAAHLAAFAVAARPHISADDFRRLYRPFIQLIPPPDELLAD